MKPSKRQSAAGTELRTPVVVPFPVPNSDVGLVMALRAGHPDSLRVLCERHTAQLVRLAARILGPDPGRDAIAAEGVARAAESIHKLEDPHALSSWLVWHVVAACRQRLKARRRWRWLAWQARHLTILEGGPYSERLLATYRILNRLRDESRIAFCLAVIEGMESVDIARCTGNSVVDVRYLLQQACTAFVRLSKDEPSILLRERQLA